MSVSTSVHAIAIRRAAQVMGSVEALRRHLQVSMTDLKRWMVGEARPPDAVFLKVVDLLSDQELARIKHGRDPGTESSGSSA
jgi:translation initiation factor IF-2